MGDIDTSKPQKPRKARYSMEIAGEKDFGLSTPRDTVRWMSERSDIRLCIGRWVEPQPAIETLGHVMQRPTTAKQVPLIGPRWKESAQSVSALSGAHSLPSNIHILYTVFRAV